MLRNHQDLIEGSHYHLVIEGGGQRLTFYVGYECVAGWHRSVQHVFAVYPFDYDSNHYGFTDAEVDFLIASQRIYEA